jgi:NAD-dependent deacetylase
MTPQLTPQTLKDAQQALGRAKRIAVLTGAGISAASGVPTFRGDGGLWRNFRAQDLATPEAYQRDPQLVWQWYQMRFNALLDVQPNAAHLALVSIESRSEDFTLVTQNVDGLHQRAGSNNVFELHGNVTQGRCEGCGEVTVLEPGFPLPPPCPSCSAPMRPNVVWFGEMLPAAALEAGIDAFNRAEVALIIGTSALVEPAASLGRMAAHAGAFVIEINPESTPLTPFANVSLQTDAVTGMMQLLT